ncbi:hypothetical protein ASPZODRAFT_63312 [Penicilliopsis zonata CBS 506.65]|uniref:Lanthionine synthetase C family protein n=1 Tax=Penicilliopsis zonata CBS 506.65 TaxID=1073090 RepID=A0A1L9SJU8_9EURO|nr:hypothetical protein ASPZODRAFT_63312 [Penicilliopsis zonata CBS 506.65]OJJ47509.1 hypothetical protein ASPZODRAFT_63312 [Penicilliopsis zonata CBS 506.65]
MSLKRPQFYPNTLQPLQIDQETLLKTLQELRVAIREGVQLIHAGDPPVGEYDGRGIFSGNLGWSKSFTPDDMPSLPDFRTLARQRIPTHGPDIPLQVGRLSPLPSNSPIAALVMRILEKATAGETALGISQSDIACLEEAVELALSHGPLAFYHGHDMGADEILFGRAGLLWAIVHIRTHVFDSETRQKFLPIFEAVPELIDVIIASGRQGAAEYVRAHGDEDALPLMWPWHEGYYGLGAAHGMTGILCVLLACRLEELDEGTARNYLPAIAGTITGLCRVCIAHNGHLPTSIPPRESSRSSPLVQICHGSPAVLMLLACARRDAYLTCRYWQQEWDEAIYLASESVWEEGLLSKGGSLCHGIAGNAWPLLLLHDCFEYDQDDMDIARRNYQERQQGTDISVTRGGVLSGDYFLSRALAMLLHSRETQPFKQSPETALNDYRMPDSPYSLFEGLSGIICAWADACAVIRARLRKMQLETDGSIADMALENDELFEECMLQQLGFPFLGGHGPSGLL